MPDLKKHFCSSPWFHMRVDNQGLYQFCRWAKVPPVSSESPLTFFRQDMDVIRKQFLNGEAVPGCNECYEMEEHGKISGRQKQLLKTGIRIDAFEKTLLSSPWIDEFKRSEAQDGVTPLSPQDWQIDLGNYCNGACVYCSPEYSSMLANEHRRLEIISELPANSWCNDPDRVNEFVKILNESKVTYLHFIGGETLITPAFTSILRSLVESGKSKEVTVGFTTNLMTWDDEVYELLTEFDNVNVGLSVDALTNLNDYARYPSNIVDVKAMLDKWVTVSAQHNWLVQLRTTPTLLTVRDLDTVYEYALNHNVIVESCNFLQRPDFLRPTVLPMIVREEIALKLTKFRAKIVIKGSQTVVNIRNPNTVNDLLSQDLESYVSYLLTAPDEYHLLPKTVDYLKKLESLRGNSVLTYLPEYEEFLRSAGY